jgi:hypothetical protein
MCSDPAPLSGSAVPGAPGYIVRLGDNVDAVAEATRLASDYDFTLTFVYIALKGFAAEMSASALAGIRCEATVLSVAHNAVVSVAR